MVREMSVKFIAPFSRARGFTLVELMVSMTVLSLILVLMFQITSNTSKLWQHTRARIDAFQAGREAYETVTANLSQAMLNTYWDYADKDGKARSDLKTDADKQNFIPKNYVRQSDLQFTSGPSSTLLATATGLTGDRTSTDAVFFQAPLGVTNTPNGLANLLNATGYFIQFSDDTNERPKFLQSSNVIPTRYRYRLMELRQATEKFSLYADTAKSTSNTFQSKKWFLDALNLDPDTRHTVAENVIALILLPKRSPNDKPSGSAPPTLAPDYNYDSRLYESKLSDPYAKISRNQLPPMVQVTMVVVDEKSIQRLAAQSGGASSTPPVELKVPAGSFTTESAYESDLAALEKQLVDKHIDYRVFSTNVSILQAKWSDDKL
jgi:uncharacterized protein (TIGR02599 family)